MMKQRIEINSIFVLEMMIPNLKSIMFPSGSHNTLL